MVTILVKEFFILSAFPFLPPKSDILILYYTKAGLLRLVLAIRIDS